LYGAENLTPRKAYQKYKEGFVMWRWRRMKKIIWIDRVRNKEVLQTVTEKKNNVQTIKRRIGHTLRRKCFLKHVIEEKTEGRIEVTGRQGRRRKQPLDDLQEETVY
jgi:hypothetical protein